MIRRLTLPLLLLVLAAVAAALPALRGDAQEITSPPSVEEVPLGDASVLQGIGWQQEVAAEANLVAVQWTGDTGAAFTIEAQGDDGQWEPAGTIGEQDNGPDPGTPEGVAAAQLATNTSEPLWTDDISAVRVTLTDGSAQDVSLVAIDSPPVGDLAENQPEQGNALAGGLAAMGVTGVAVAFVSGRRRLLALGVLAAIVAVGCAPAKKGPPGAPVPDSIVSHATWGGDLPWQSGNAQCGTSGPAYASDIGFAVVHHTVNSNFYTPDQSVQVIRGIWAHHANVNQWCDIGYNFLIDRFGRIFEGRWGGWDQAVVGAHAVGFNTGGVGIAFIGDHRFEPVTGESYASLINLIAWKFQVHTVDATPWNSIIGHRDVNATECPGNAAYGLLPGIRDAVRQRV
ncbi:MAG: N-acetylmuramoyl-L-alanine amidase [Acidimicrobiia bacterium]